MILKWISITKDDIINKLSRHCFQWHINNLKIELQALYFFQNACNHNSLSNWTTKSFAKEDLSLKALIKKLTFLKRIHQTSGDIVILGQYFLQNF